MAKLARMRKKPTAPRRKPLSDGFATWIERNVCLPEGLTSEPGTVHGRDCRRDRRPGRARQLRRDLFPNA
jgi:hypothetical protein